MYPKLFFENFWQGEKKDILFVFMPFHESFQKKFRTIIQPAAEVIFNEKEGAIKSDQRAGGHDITNTILDGIANSKMLLFDLSGDPELLSGGVKQPNGCVLYELGVATAIREPSDILLIKEESPDNKEIFNIRGYNLVEYEKGELSKERLVEELKKVLKQQENDLSRQVKAVAKLVDEIGISFMIASSIRKRGDDNFSIPEENLAGKISALRLVDLGVLYTLYNHGERKFSYHWTEFGYKVRDYLFTRHKIKVP